MLASNSDLAEIVNDLLDLRPEEDLAIDTETTGTAIYSGDTIRGISVAYRDKAWYIPITHPDSVNIEERWVPALVAALNACDALWIYHNAPFDWPSLGQLGVEIPARHWDTQVVSWLMDENGTHALKGLAARIWGEDEKEEQAHIKRLFKGELASDVYKRLRADGWPVQAAKLEAKELAMASKKTWATLTAEDIAAYAEKDAEMTLRLKHWQEVELAKGGETDPRPDIERELMLQRVINRMVERGVGVDLEMVKAFRAKNLARMWEIEPMFEGVNLNSPKQLAKLIYEDWGLPVGTLTKTGAPSTSREALEELEGAHGDLDALIEFRRLAKAVGTYYDNLIANADEQGRVHTGFCTTCTVTGRLSSRAPNLMNIPREETDADVKKVFSPAPGMELWEFDLKSAELYVGASITQDDDMLAALETPGRDFHTETALSVFGNVEGNNRTLAKNLNYGIPYGIGPEKFALYIVKGTGRGVAYCHRCAERSRNNVKWTATRPCNVCQARNMISRHRLAWPKTHLGIDRLTTWAQQHHFVPLHKAGRFRHFHSPGVIVPAYTAFNAVVQGGVAEVAKDWMLHAEVPLAKAGAFMVLQVHDSLWIELLPGTSDAVAETLQTALDQANPFRARLTLESKKLA